MSKVCLRVVVSGRVQGVWFRRFTQQKAEAHGVLGWVRNLADGRVEALLCGDEINVRHVEAWMSQGPELANVAELLSEEQPWQADYADFQVLEDAEG
ncbi:MAG: acylphosphatase [Nitrincola lacisaponensis]|uniref:acylphosphatase n=1 Tax=Nitrincola lacisaponensis TaxID=267850 RepID=UPI0039196506